MRLSRIITAIAVGLAVAAVPTAAGAALFQPQPPPTSPQDPPQPPPYPPAVPTLTVSPSTVLVGEPVTVTGSGFAPNELVEITITTSPLAAGAPAAERNARRADGSTVALASVAYQRKEGPPGGHHEHKGGTWDGAKNCDRQVFTVRADAQGSFSFTFRPRCPGRVTITARGLESGRTATAVLTVLKRYDHGGGKLPVTGSSNMDLPLRVGGGLVGAGAVMLLGTFLWRRRDRFGAGAAG